MDKALTCEAGGQGWNPEQDLGFFSVLLSSRLPHHVNSLSHNACWPANSGFITEYGGGNKESYNMEKSKQRHLWRRNTKVRCLGKGLKKFLCFVLFLLIAYSPTNYHNRLLKVYRNVGAAVIFRKFMSKFPVGAILKM